MRGGGFAEAAEHLDAVEAAEEVVAEGAGLGVGGDDVEDFAEVAVVAGGDRLGEEPALLPSSRLE